MDFRPIINARVAISVGIVRDERFAEKEGLKKVKNSGGGVEDLDNNTIVKLG